MSILGGFRPVNVEVHVPHQAGWGAIRGLGAGIVDGASAFVKTLKANVHDGDMRRLGGRWPAGEIVNTTPGGDVYLSEPRLFMSNVERMPDAPGAQRLFAFVEGNGNDGPQILWASRPIASGDDLGNVAKELTASMRPALGGDPPTVGLILRDVGQDGMINLAEGRLRTRDGAMAETNNPGAQFIHRTPGYTDNDIETMFPG